MSITWGKNKIKKIGFLLSTFKLKRTYIFLNFIFSPLNLKKGEGEEKEKVLPYAQILKRIRRHNIQNDLVVFVSIIFFERLDIC